jgi:hypothetical protein
MKDPFMARDCSLGVKSIENSAQNFNFASQACLNETIHVKLYQIKHAKLKSLSQPKLRL